MLRLRIAPIWALLVLLSVSLPSHAFFDPPYVTPAHPVAGETVSINVRMGVCDGIFNEPGFPKVTQNGSSVHIAVAGSHLDPGGGLCSYPTGTGTFPIGSFTPGNYVVSFDLLYIDFFSQPQTLHLGDVPFTVARTAQPAVPAPTLNQLGLLMLTLAVLGFATRRLRGSSVLLVAILCTPLGVRAQAIENRMIEIMVTDAPGAPTPAQIVNYYTTNIALRPPTPPLQAFSIKNPQTVQYFIPDRATGEFLARLRAKPNSARAKLEAMMVATFEAATDIAPAMAALEADPYVAVAYEPLPMQPSSVSLTDFHIDPDPALASNDAQYGWRDLGIEAAWKLAGGYALVGQIDYGMFVAHPALKQFSITGQFLGGNFVPAASRDVSLTGQTPPANFDAMNVDEAKPLNPPDPACNSSVPTDVGHGTHVAGLLAANGASGQGVQGTCKHCGLSIWKWGQPKCFTNVTPAEVHLYPNPLASDRGQIQAIDNGTQINSLSLGTSSTSAGLTFCNSHPSYSACLALAYAKARDITSVASSGNDRNNLNFPASDPRVLSVGGVDATRALWNESPPDTFTNCPFIVAGALPGLECGSNLTRTIALNGFNHQEVVASAKSVLSTTYPNFNYQAYAHCGDQYQSSGLTWGNGIGLCTGTSMSAPQIAGVVGILRSINPLVPTGVPQPATGTPLGIRAVLVQTTIEAQAAQAWNPLYGHGHPDAAAAARVMLGKVAGAVVRNRVTPLFRLRSDFAKDNADTTSPQYALSLMINQEHNYVQPSASPEVPGYTFPYDPTSEARPDAPRASVYVLTTEYTPRSQWPALIPLYMMDKPKSGGTDYLLATSKLEIEAAHAAGYNLRTIQGYIYQPCAPESTCVPPSAQKLWRQYKAADNDCAVFLDSEKPSFEAAGYTAACSTGPTKMIGYAYPATDSDGDGLPDGFEYVVGTNPNAADSDGDDTPDGIEFPLAGIATGDPCMGGSLGASNCGADRIFKNGFDAP